MIRILLNSPKDVFLCHNKSDKDWVRELGTKIESEKFNGNTLKVFFDEWDIKPSDNLIDKINDGLNNSKHLMIILSPDMVNAPWPNAEWQSFYMNDPGGRKGTLIPILYRTCDIPPLLRPITRLDFRDHKEFNRNFRKLIAILTNQPLPRGNQSETRQIVEVIHELDTKEPDKVIEKITSNMYPVITLPKFIWCASTVHTTYKTAIAQLRRTNGKIPVFILKEKKLYTFSNLHNEQNSLQQIIDLDDIERFSIKKWKDDSIKSSWLMEILNKSLFLHLQRKGLSYDKKHRRYFIPSSAKGNGGVQIEWIPTKRKTVRLLVGAVKNPTTNMISYWKHQASRIQFINLAGNIFLQIIPAYTFTIDGSEPVDPKRAGKLSTRWTHDEYNSKFLYNLAFWIFFLRSSNFTLTTGVDEINNLNLLDQKNIISVWTGGININISTIPMTSDMVVGIESDSHPLEKLLDTVTDDLPDLEAEESLDLDNLDMEDTENDEFS